MSYGDILGDVDRGQCARNILWFSSENERLLFGLTTAIAVVSGGYLSSQGFFGGFEVVQGFTKLLPDWFWESTTIFGDERMLLAMVMPLCLRFPKLLWRIALAAIIAGLLARGIKLWFQLPRPAAVLSSEDILIIGHKLMGKSFPSGHSASVFAFAGIWIALLGRRYVAPFLLVAAVIALSRIAVGAHWPADTLFGSTLGMVSAWIALQLAKFWDFGEQKTGRRILVAIVVLGVATLPMDGQGYPGSLPIRTLLCLWALYMALLTHLEWKKSGGFLCQEQFSLNAALRLR